ncbi:MAG: AbrB/MazE/SpoVT family DNA-binding domain-containing protein [Thermomicrobiales bacterium]|nr:AbrB/MazE/SpoVT family DNA-binding domain-containing protein [Thermomicrobiales bacterium]
MSTQITRVRKKGQITLPADVRRDMDLHEGDVIHFERRGSETVLVKDADIVARTAGALAKYVTDGPVVVDRDQIWAEIAQEKEDRILRQIAEESGEYVPD